MEILYKRIETPISSFIVGTTDDGCCMMEFEFRNRIQVALANKEKQFNAKFVQGTSPLHDRIESSLNKYLKGELQEFNIPLDYEGTPFQKRVWKELIKIPYGETRSYKDIAIALGNPNSVRAVGGANGANNIAIIIPCHRVIRADGNLQGYGGGLPTKQRLLNLEKDTFAQQYQTSLQNW